MYTMEIHLAGRLSFLDTKYIKKLQRYYRKKTKYVEMCLINVTLFFVVSSMIHWSYLNECSERRTREIVVWGSTEEEVERDLVRAAIVDLDRVLSVADHHLRLAIVDLAVHPLNEDHRDRHYHSDLVVALRNEGREAAAFPSAGTLFLRF